MGCRQSVSRNEDRVTAFKRLELSIKTLLPGFVTPIAGLLLMAILLHLIFSGDVRADGQSPKDLSDLTVGQLQNRLSQMDAELTQLARYSLQSGVGAIGFRSQSHAAPNNTEWVEVIFPDVTAIDEVVLVQLFCETSIWDLPATHFRSSFVCWRATKLMALMALMTTNQQMRSPVATSLSMKHWPLLRTVPATSFPSLRV